MVYLALYQLEWGRESGNFLGIHAHALPLTLISKRLSVKKGGL